MSDISPFDFEAFDGADRQAQRQRLEQSSLYVLALSANIVDRTELLLQQAEDLLARAALVSTIGETPLSA